MSGKALPEYHPFRSAEARDRYLAHYDELSAAWPLPSEVRMVESDEGTTFVRVHGPEDAPPLFVLNGAWCNSLAWSSEMIAKFTAGYRTYTLDGLYDFGRSVSARVGGSAADYTAWLDDLFGALGLESGVNLFGISRGAWISAEYVLHAPQRVAKAVWLWPALVIQRASWRNALNAPHSIAGMINPNARTIGAMMRDLMPEMERNDKKEFDDFVDEMVLGLKCFIPQMRAPLGPRVFSDAELAGIEVPVLCVLGETETILSVPDAVRRLAKVAPQIETAVFPGAGHALITLQMEAMTDRVLQFLNA